MSELNYELAPRVGMPASQRKQELDAARFVAVRNLAYMVYKKPDGSPLMTYQETLEDRERVKANILQHEIALNLVTNDLGAAPQGTQVNGAVQHMQPSNTQFAAPGMQVAPGVGQPQQQPVQQMAPTQPMQPAPQAAYTAPLGVAPPASPQQAVQAAQGAPPQQAAPEQAPTSGRKRRSTAGGAPQAGASVAPPPGAVPGQLQPSLMPQGVPQQMTPGFTPTQPMTASPAPAQGGYGVPGQLAQPQAAPNDPGQLLTAVLQRLDDLGQGLTSISKDLDELAQRQTMDEALLGKVHIDTLQALAALHHIYGSTGGLTQALQQKGVQTLDQFRSYLTPNFTGNP